MIFYFSGTGDSQRTALQISEILGDEIISMNKYLKKGEKDAFHSENPLVFAAPTYSWQMPRVSAWRTKKPSGTGIVHTAWPVSEGVPQRPLNTNPSPKETADITLWKIEGEGVK